MLTEADCRESKSIKLKGSLAMQRMERHPNMTQTPRESRACL